VKLNVANILERTEVNGPGVRTLLHLQGCRIHCPGCFNEWSWEDREVRLVEARELAAELLHANNQISISGGEPMDQEEGLLELVEELRRLDGGCSVLLFTGYTEKQLSGKPLWARIKDMLDIAVIGPYVRNKPTRQGLRSSLNQTVYYGPRQRKDRIEMLTGASVEAIVSPDGTIHMTGFPTPQTIAALRAQGDTDERVG